MKTFKFKTNKEEMLEHLKMDAQMASTLLNSPLIASDMDIFVKWFNVNDEAAKAGLGVDYEEKHLLYSNVYVAIRNQGVEFGSSKEKVIERCKVLGQPFATYLIKVKYGSDEEVTIIKNLK